MFNKLKIKKKLILSFVLIAIIASISGIYSIFVCTNMNTQYSDAMANHGFSQGTIGLYGISVSECDSALRSYAGYLLPEAMQEQKDLYAEQKANCANYLPEIQPTLTTDEGKAVYAKLQSAHDAYFAEAESLMSRMNVNMSTEERIAYQTELANELTPLYDTLFNACLEMMNFKSDLGNEVDSELTSSMHVSTIIAIVLTIASLILGLLFGTMIANGIAKPMNNIVDRLRDMKQGDISSPAPTVRTEDEIRDVTDVFDEIIKHLDTVFKDMIYVFETMAAGDFTVTSKHRDLYIGDLAPIFASMVDLKTNVSSTLMQIHQSADQVASGSEQVANGSQALSQGATEQASSVEELAATINEISTRVTENAANAREAKDKATEAGRSMEASNDQMRELIAAMNDISSSSAEIGKIIKTIEDIAFQTNILALNAAVEAARAGSAGKGFAVVADEVRNLASKSAEASANTATLIEASIKAVENGSSIADATAASLMESVRGAEEVVGLVEHINDASAEQANQINQVSVGIDQISSVVQTNSATAEESAAASEELSGQSALLKSLVAKFKLEGVANTAMYAEPIHSAPSHSYSSMDYDMDFGDKY